MMDLGLTPRGARLFLLASLFLPLGIEAQAQQTIGQPLIRLAQTPGVNIPLVPGMHDPLKECTSSNPPEKKVEYCTEAIERKLTRSKNELSEAHFYRGVAYMDMKIVDKAISDFTASIDLQPVVLGNVNAYYNRALSYIAKGAIEQAIVDLRAILVELPRHKPALEKLKALKGK